MPPISTEPNGPSPVIMGAVLSGMGISISVMSAMPRSPITMYSGISLLIFRATPLWSTPISIGTLWPMAFIVW